MDWGDFGNWEGRGLYACALRLSVSNIHLPSLFLRGFRSLTNSAYIRSAHALCAAGLSQGSLMFHFVGAWLH